MLVLPGAIGIFTTILKKAGFELDLFVPEDIYGAISAAKKLAIRDRIRELKAFAIKAGNIDITAVWHKCYHDETPVKPCEPKQDI